MEPVLSPDKEKVGPPPCTAGTEHALLCQPDTSLLKIKELEVDKARVATRIIVSPAETGKKADGVILSIEPFNSRLCNKNYNQAWRMCFGDISYGLGTYYNNFVVDTIFFQIFTK